MISLKKRNQGFTIVELLIVIVVIGILAAIVVATYNGIQQKARNTKRQADMTSLQTQLEVFFQQNGYYPSLGDMNNASWRQANIKGLDNVAIKDPSNTTCDPTSNTGNCFVAAPAAKSYAYAVTDASNASCEAADTNCANYVLTATYEGTVGGATTVVKKSQN